MKFLTEGRGCVTTNRPSKTSVSLWPEAAVHERPLRLIAARREVLQPTQRIRLGSTEIGQALPSRGIEVSSLALGDQIANSPVLEFK